MRASQSSALKRGFATVTDAPKTPRTFGLKDQQVPARALQPETDFQAGIGSLPTCAGDGQLLLDPTKEGNGSYMRHDHGVKGAKARGDWHKTKDMQARPILALLRH
jgi:hypothetical protein